MSQTVLISGATGFIAAHTVQQLLQKNYKVVGSVRSTEKGEKLKESLNDPNFSYEVVSDIVADGAFDDFVKNHPEATIFLHTASPFHFNITDIAKDLLEPAVNGTKSALTAIKKYGPQIKRVVVTSSYAAIGDFASPQSSKNVDTEDTWSPLTWETSLANPLVGYCGSKTLAEQAAWKFVEEEKPNFILSTVNPVYVFGPQPFDEQAGAESLNTSSEIINSVLKATSEDKIPSHVGDAVDVRDVAAAHIVAFEKDDAKEQRLLLTSEPFTQQDILDILHKDFPEDTKDLPLGTPGSGKEKFETKNTLDNSKTRKILGFTLKTLDETVHDSVEQLLKVRKWGYEMFIDENTKG